MKRISLLLAVCLLFGCLVGCTTAKTDPVVSVTDAPTPDTTDNPVNEAADTAPVVSEAADPEPAAVSTPDTAPEPAPEAPNEGDVDSNTQAQINALEQSSSVRDDDVAPVEASAYCKLTVTCEALLERQDQLTDVLLPPDGIFYSGTIVLIGGETALQLIADKLAACGLICRIEGDDIEQVAAISGSLQEDMEWVVLCNDIPLDDPDTYVIQSGDVLELSYMIVDD